jgi:hypothetical protein
MSVVVVGSRARGQHYSDSDIDLVVVSREFAQLSRPQRIDLLLGPWSGQYALEPFGFTPDEVMDPRSLHLWDALADGRVLVDDEGAWERAREAFRAPWDGGEFKRRQHGWWATI